MRLRYHLQWTICGKSKVGKSKMTSNCLVNRGLLQLESRFRWHERSLGRRVLLPELIRHLLHRHKLNAFMLLEVLDQPLMHQQQMWSSRYIRVDCDGLQEC